LEEGDGVSNVKESRINLELGAKPNPDLPMDFGSLGSLGGDAGGNFCRQSSEVSFEATGGDRWRICQGLVWG
jgi:hypothetical protein